MCKGVSHHRVFDLSDFHVVQQVYHFLKTNARHHSDVFNTAQGHTTWPPRHRDSTENSPKSRNRTHSKAFMCQAKPIHTRESPAQKVTKSFLFPKKNLATKYLLNFPHDTLASSGRWSLKHHLCWLLASVARSVMQNKSTNRTLQAKPGNQCLLSFTGHLASPE